MATTSHGSSLSTSATWTRRNSGAIRLRGSARTLSRRSATRRGPVAPLGYRTPADQPPRSSDASPYPRPMRTLGTASMSVTATRCWRRASLSLAGPPMSPGSSSRAGTQGSAAPRACTHGRLRLAGRLSRGEIVSWTLKTTLSPTRTPILRSWAPRAYRSQPRPRMHAGHRPGVTVLRFPERERSYPRDGDIARITPGASGPPLWMLRHHRIIPRQWTTRCLRGTPRHPGSEQRRKLMVSEAQ